jgi:hypothetical protein
VRHFRGNRAEDVNIVVIKIAVVIMHIVIAVIRMLRGRL